MRGSHGSRKPIRFEQNRVSQAMHKIIANAWSILIILLLLAVIAYSIYTQIAHHI